MGKLMIHLCVSRNFKSYHRFILLFVISALHNLGETALAKNLHDFIPVCDMVSNLNSQVAFKIIEDRVSVDFCIFRLCFFM
jgi:hypothetical protein